MHNYSKLDTPEILPLLFRPPLDTVGYCPENAEDVVLTVAPEVSLACRFYRSAADAPTLFYFHGGNESCDTFNGEAGNFVGHGMNVFLASYRGYGKSTGSPSVSSLFADSRALFSLAAEWLKDQGYSGPIFVMGRSLGSVCAIDLVHAQSEMIKGLLVESGFCETVTLLQALGVTIAAGEMADPEGFDNIRKIAGIKLPTMIFHGAKDGLVSVAQAEKLQASSGARNKQFFVIPGAGHDTVSKIGGDLYFQKIKEFLNTVCGVNTWRQRRKEYKGNKSGERA
jgi:hypothetical protein